ncbi:MAG: hypothetical protein AAGI25_15530 [Bacteroidota bacterium]
MKKQCYLVALSLFFSFLTDAQTEQGNFLLEVGFTPISGSSFDGQLAPSTGLQLWTSDGNTVFNVGAESGYFIADDFAIKLGLGFLNISPDGGDSESSFSYKVGAKYYINSVVPVQLDITGSTLEDDDLFEVADPFWLGIQAGYAVFFSEQAALEPSLRYNISLNDDFSDDGIFEIRFGFSIFF